MLEGVTEPAEAYRKAVDKEGLASTFQAKGVVWPPESPTPAD